MHIIIPVSIAIVVRFILRHIIVEGDKNNLNISNEVIRIRQSKDRQQNGQNKKDKQQSTKHYT